MKEMLRGVCPCAAQLLLEVHGRPVPSSTGKFTLSRARCVRLVGCSAMLKLNAGELAVWSDAMWRVTSMCKGNKALKLHRKGCKALSKVRTED